MPDWRIEVRHDGLNKTRVFAGNDKLAVEAKAAQQKLTWEKEWSAKLRTDAANTEIEALRTALSRAIAFTPHLRWNSFKLSEAFSEPPPQVPAEPEMPPEPKPTDPSFQPSFIARLLSLKGESKRRFAQAHAEWARRKSEVDVIRTTYAEQLAAWDARNRRFVEPRAAINQTIDNMRKGYEQSLERYHNGEAEWISAIIGFVLSYFSLPVVVGQQKALQTEGDATFSPASGILVVECSLPSLADLPNLKEVRYVSSRDRFDEIKLRPNEINQLYDDLIYQLCLRTLHLTFLFDSKGVVKSAVFNGWVTFPDPATGNERRACILSVQAEREVFAKINLERVDPKTCFRALKGVGSAQLHGMVPVAPLLRGNRDDPRFIESVEVADRIREGTNLAAIGWEDFEQLIREVFEMEFKSAGGEVRVTRASRDWGVDAIAFDPDPIRGGKIVIQAKRYTNTVEVSAVRDLYGTVMNEGATKGILVTTSTFGPEAYAFAKDKPLTLMDGSNLLHLLERHGHRAHIDLAEAKRLNQTPLARSLTR